MSKSPFNLIAEQRLRAAEARGDLRNLPGQGQPLAPDDAAHLPAALRAAYKILKNHGLLPIEAQLLKDIESLRREIEQAPADDLHQSKRLQELEALCLEYNSRAKRHAALDQSSLKALINSTTY